MVALTCLADGKTAAALMVCPFIKVGQRAVPNPEYAEAPFELTVVNK